MPGIGWKSQNSSLLTTIKFKNDMERFLWFLYEYSGLTTTLYNVCAVLWGVLSTVGVFSTVGGYHEYHGGYHEYRGGYLEYRGGVQYHGGYHDKCGGIS